MSEAAAAQVVTLKAVLTVLRSVGVSAWLFGGWGLTSAPRTSTGRPDGSFQPRGRYSDWHFPPGSFGDDLGTLDGDLVPTMSVAGMLAMKEQFPHLRNGTPWREKDIADIETLRGLLAVGRRP